MNIVLTSFLPFLLPLSHWFLLPLIQLPLKLMASFIIIFNYIINTAAQAT